MPNGLATRLLVLGVVSIFEPANGYQIRRELASWEIEAWADVKVGSIYSMLTTLTKQGFITRHDLADEGRPVAVYALSSAGRTEFERLVGVGLDGSATMDRSVFQTAVAFAPLLERAPVVEHLRTRLVRARESSAGLRHKIESMSERHVPPSVRHFLGLDLALLESEEQWLSSTVEQLQQGALAFRGESPDWEPAPDDAGWEMARQSSRYRALLAGRRGDVETA